MREKKIRERIRGVKEENEEEGRKAKERWKEGALPLTLIQLLNSRQSTQSSNTTAATAQYSETLPLSTRLFFKAAEMSSRILKGVPAVNNVKISSTYH